MRVLIASEQKVTGGGSENCRLRKNCAAALALTRVQSSLTCRTLVGARAIHQRILHATHDSPLGGFYWGFDSGEQQQRVFALGTYLSPSASSASECRVPTRSAGHCFVRQAGIATMK